MLLIEEQKLEAIRQYMLRNKETVAVAESVTAGLLQWGFSSIPDASLFFNGGITAYNLDQKGKHLDVERVHAEEVNCVSQKVATEMSVHVCNLMDSDWGIGITGYASPVPESGNKLFAYYAIAHRGQCMKVDKLIADSTDPKAVQFYYASSIMDSFVQLLM